MFQSLPSYFREHKLAADVRTIMLLRKAINKGLVRTTGDLYVTLRGLITTSPKEFGPFATAFYQYFLDIDIKKGESLDSAILRSETFQQWKLKKIKDLPEGEEPNIKELIDEFLNDVHLTSYDIDQFLKGEDILNNDDPNMADDPNGQDGDIPPLNRMADYENMSLEELLERMKKVAEQQKRQHRGGNHWIGQDGASPYGNRGGAKGGIRKGGSGGGKMARKVIGDKNFYPVDTKVTLKDDNIDVALSYLKGIEEESTEELLDIPVTIKEGVKQGGLFLPHIKEKIDQKVEVILLIDNGGWSMTPYIKNVTKLFSKMKRRFAHDLKTYYYHNTIYGGVYADAARSKFVTIKKFNQQSKNYSVFVIGDADMAPYELGDNSIRDWNLIKERFPRMAWMNPLEERFWAGSYTINVLKQVVPMFPLSPYGIEKAVQEMNRKKRFGKYS